MRHTTVLFAMLLLVGAVMLTAYAVRHPVAVDAIEPTAVGHRIAVNRADAGALQLLPGVGPTIARNIVEHRERVGPITEAVELEQVPQIGPTTRERMTPWVSFELPSEGVSGVGYTQEHHD